MSADIGVKWLPLESNPEVKKAKEFEPISILFK
jgi:hypothetical protein